MKWNHAVFQTKSDGESYNLDCLFESVAPVQVEAIFVLRMDDANWSYYEEKEATIAAVSRILPSVEEILSLTN